MPMTPERLKEISNDCDLVIHTCSEHSPEYKYAKYCLELLTELDEIREELCAFEAEIKKLHHHSISSLPDASRGSLKEAYIRGESRALEFILAALAKIRST